MKTTAILCFFLCPLLISAVLAGTPALTIYNQNFAVVRDTVPLDLKQGVNDVRFTETTAHLETDSVILRDPNGKMKLQILEQNYRNDQVSQERDRAGEERPSRPCWLGDNGQPERQDV